MWLIGAEVRERHTQTKTWRCYVAGLKMEGGARSQWMAAASGKDKKKDSLLEPPEGTKLAYILILAKWDFWPPKR